ncbi:hypothetical protein CSB45_05480 [candidate division KSB3 bacterium]|uniref:Uncharacterized protein n=1 Tax=candidate division KSB3 bacterium TaxID=2044937 RepID=A0A2G6E8Q1_9BACT|nr:MAG: hypothetical protein CSB45_05480 [candidate division KSB3 bacterium]
MIELNLDDLPRDEDLVAFLNRFSKTLSFLINRENYDPHYGTIYVDIDLFQLTIATNDDRWSVKDKLKAKMREMVSTMLEQIDACDNSLLLDFYYEGLRTELEKSKFFHWFHVLEFLEESELYKRKFNSERLFSPEEVTQIKTLAKSMDSDRKRGIITGVLRHTAKNREEKIFELLTDMGITS